MKNITVKITPERTTTLDGTMTFGTTDGGQLVLGFASTEENVELTPLTATCRVQVMRRGDVHIVELPCTPVKRNPQVFDGHRITVTRRDDGSLRPNFKPVAMGPGFDVEAYASEVEGELLRALTSLLAR